MYGIGHPCDRLCPSEDLFEQMAPLGQEKEEAWVLREESDFGDRVVLGEAEAVQRERLTWSPYSSLYRRDVRPS